MRVRTIMQLAVVMGCVALATGCAGDGVAYPTETTLGSQLVEPSDDPTGAEEAVSSDDLTVADGVLNDDGSVSRDDGTRANAAKAPTRTGQIAVQILSAGVGEATGAWQQPATCWEVPGSVFVSYGLDLDGRVDGAYTNYMFPDEPEADYVFIAQSDLPEGHVDWSGGEYDPKPLTGTLEMTLDGDYGPGPSIATHIVLDVGASGLSGSLWWQDDHNGDVLITWSCA